MMSCDHFDPITASSAPCCIVCSSYGPECPEVKKTAPVLAHEDGSVNQTRNGTSSQPNFIRNSSACKAKAV